MTQAVLGVDIGTSGTRCLLVDADGAVLASTDVGYEMSRPQPGWAEQDPDDWWEAFVSAVREVTGRAAELGVTIGAIGLSGQQAGLVAVDEKGAAVGPGVLWCDNRSDDAARAIQAVAHGQALRYGGPVTGAQWAAKLRWQRERGLAAPYRVMGVKDYVRSRLCPDAHLTDPVEASVSGLFDVGTGSWVAERLESLGLDAAAVPTVADPDAPAGWLSADTAAVLGVSAGIPVTVGLGDCGSAGLGAGAVAPGDEYLGFGSSGITFRVQDDYAPDPELRARTCRYTGGDAGRTWFTMGVVQTLGLSWTWWRGVLGTFAGRNIDHADLEEICSASPPGARGLVFLPYLMGDQTPHMDGRLRGGFVGLDISHTADDLARAVLEGMAFAMWDAFRVLPGTAGTGPLTVTGKAVNNRLWLEILAAVVQRPLASVAVHEGSAYGAAMLAQAMVDGTPVDQVSHAWVRAADEPIFPDEQLAEPMQAAYDRYLAAFPAAGVLPLIAT